MTHFTVEPGEVGRIDRVIQARFPGASRRQLARLFRDGHVRIDGRVAKKGATVTAGAEVVIDAEVPTPESLPPTPTPDAPLVVLHEDARIVAIDKPAGTPSHPLRAGEVGTVANALVARYPECAGVGDDPREAGLAHRLDRDTTGVIVAARDADAWRHLRDAFSFGQVRKQYLALVAARVTEPGESSDDIGGQPAHTDWFVDRAVGDFTLLRVVAHTGRMHQVRVHLARAGYPIVGDTRYGGPPADTGCMLHASLVDLPHPDGGRVTIEAPLPADRAARLM